MEQLVDTEMASEMTSETQRSVIMDLRSSAQGKVFNEYTLVLHCITARDLWKLTIGNISQQNLMLSESVILAKLADMEAVVTFSCVLGTTSVHDMNTSLNNRTILLVSALVKA